MPFWNVCHYVEVVRNFECSRKILWNHFVNKEEWNFWAEQGQISVTQDGLKGEKYGEGCIIEYETANGITIEKITSYDDEERFTYSILSGGYWIQDHTGEVIIDPISKTECKLYWRGRFNTEIVGLGWALEMKIKQDFEAVLDKLEIYLRGDNKIYSSTSHSNRISGFEEP